MRIASPWWLFSAFPSLSSAATPLPVNGTRGIDLFEIHLPVNWKNAVADGVEFAFVKATEGSSYKNPRYPSQRENALTNAPGIFHGAIHFASAASSSGADQATFFLNNGGNWTADGQTLPGVLEMEGNIAGKLCHGMEADEITAWMVDFSHTYEEATGRPPLLFLSALWWAKCAGNYTSFGETHPLWLANWADEMGELPVGWDGAMFWQYAAMSGSGGEGDVFLGRREDLKRFALGL